MSKFIYSTLTLSSEYVDWHLSPGKLPRPGKRVRIQGGANVPDKTLITPRGVVTKVTDEDYEFLRENRVFKLQVANGNIRVEDREHKVEKVVRDMTPKDGSSPLVPEDFPEGEEPSVGPPDQDEDPAPTPRRRRGRQSKEA